MSVATFVDSSILVKLFDTSVPAKRTAALAVLETERRTGAPTVSSAVLAEVFHALTKGREETDGRDLPPIMTRADAALAIPFLLDLNVVPVGTEAFAASLTFLVQYRRLGSWDALHLATAVAAGCRTLLTWDTDFADGSTVGGVTSSIRHIDQLTDHREVRKEVALPAGSRCCSRRSPAARHSARS